MSAPETKDATPEGGNYVNPSESLPRWLLSTQAYGLRSAATLGFNMGNYASPAPPSPTRTVWLDSTIGQWPGSKKIQVHIFVPQSSPEASTTEATDNATSDTISEDGDYLSAASGTSTPAPLTPSVSHANSITTPGGPSSLGAGSTLAPPRPSMGSRASSTFSIRNQRERHRERKTRRKANAARKRPALINFHGGGFTIGAGTDDSRWAVAAMEVLDCVVFSVDYRLAPGYPFPTSTEDCVDAIMQICRDADSYGVDTSLGVMVSGFSAGATLSLSSWLVLQDPRRWGYDLGEGKKNAAGVTTTIPKITGMALFYPLLNYTLDRAEKRARCPRPDLTLPPSTTDLCDASYIYPPVAPRQRLDPRLSPGLMEDTMVDKLPPVHLCLCEQDMLLIEGKEFAARLEARNKEVTLRVAEGEQHAWDKQPRMTIKENVAVEYAEATRMLKKCLEKM